jgi:hypothetical protein
MSSSIETSYSRAGHSADVKMHLVLDGCTRPIRQLGRDFLMLEKPFDHPPADAILVVEIDGRLREKAVWLPNGISRDAKVTAITKANR